MIIGIPRERHRHENRVGLTPSVVGQLARRGHTVLVETEAGAAAHFSDQDYTAAGARIVYGGDEATMRADLVCRVGQVTADELPLLRPGSAICSFHSLAVVRAAIVRRLCELELSVIGYEIIRDDEGRLPVLEPLSEMAGQMAVHVATHYLQSGEGGRGILLGDVPGVAPPTVLILGAGAVGGTAARRALAAGAHVIVVDQEMARLRALHRDLAGRVVSALPSRSSLARYTAIADVVIGAVLVPGARTPDLVTEEMVRGMKPGSVIVDVSIDQGGCVETSRPTTPEDPVYRVHDVIHYCVPNMTASIPRTASRGLANGCRGYVFDLADRGLERALAGDPGLAAGVYLYRGRVVNAGVAEGAGLELHDLGELLAGEEESW